MSTTAVPTDLAPTTDDEPVLLDWLHTMREQHPVWQDRYGVWHVFRHGDVEAILRDPATFSSDTSRLVPAGAEVRRGMLTQIDPPEHRALRHLVSAAFTPRTVAALEPRIRAVTGELLDAASERFDLVDALAFPLPVIVIAELLGLPAEDRELFRTWADGLFSMQVDDPSDPELAPRIAAAMADITAYLTEHCRDRRAEPRDDLISALVTAEVDGRRLDDEEAANFSMLLLLAGHITTTLLLGNAVRTFDEHPGVWDELRADPSLIPGAVEEVLRYRSPFTQVARATLRPAGPAGGPGGSAGAHRALPRPARRPRDRRACRWAAALPEGHPRHPDPARAPRPGVSRSAWNRRKAFPTGLAASDSDLGRVGHRGRW